jgi:hypothetical protein
MIKKPFIPLPCSHCSKADKKHGMCTLNSLPLSEVKDCCLWYIIMDELKKPRAPACPADGTGGFRHDR